MGKIIVKNAVEREPGYLYYIDKEGNVCEAKMKRGRKKKWIKETRTKRNWKRIESFLIRNLIGEIQNLLKRRKKKNENK